MSRTIKWLIPAVAFALLLCLPGEQTRAQDEKKKTGTVSGTVTNEEGKPAANVRVRVVVPPPPPKPKEGEQPPAARAAQQEGGKQRPGQGERPPRGEGERPPRAEGEKPPRDEGEQPQRRERMKPVAEGTTDEEGKFSIENVPAGKFMVVAGGRGQGMARQPIEVKEGETVTVALQLKPPPKREAQ